MDAGHGIPCVIYAAKSTEDKRGSIPGQLRECAEAIDGDPRRVLVAEYQDEAFSAYRRDRGPGLRDAIQHAEDLAAEHGLAEMWAQHSDRIARGDGRAARHTVEIALWALKHDVRVRTLQDPDTFRDLLYAVVTGQRNNEDSKRKGLASQAGMRRAAERGEFIGHLPDGYRLVTWIEEGDRLCKRMEFDPERQPLLELIFRLALRGRSTGQIAKTVNDRSWLTKQIQSRCPPRPFDLERIHLILKNPRYAGLSVRGGEIMARDCWPAYISERQHERIIRHHSQPHSDRHHRHRETYLLARLAKCGRCGRPLHVLTGLERGDGTHSRRYVCSGHIRHRGSAQCQARPIDAHTAEAMVVASIGTLLGGNDPGRSVPAQEALEAKSADAARSRLRAAVLVNDEPAVDLALETLFARMQPHAALIRGAAISQRRARELEDAERLRTWIEQESHARTDETRAESVELSKLLRSWFSAITIEVTAKQVLLVAVRTKGSDSSSARAGTAIDRAAWTRFASGERRQMVRFRSWEDVEIIGALQAWADTHGHAPAPGDWVFSSANHPSALTLRKHFRSWNRALCAAGLEPLPPRVEVHPWDRLDTIEALRAWTERHGRPPWSMEWWRAQPGCPCSQTVREHFGSWQSALQAAGLELPPPRPRSKRRWASEEIRVALRDWTAAHGRAPMGSEWVESAEDHPSSSTVRSRFGSWTKALSDAGLESPMRDPLPRAAPAQPG